MSGTGNRLDLSDDFLDDDEKPAVRPSEALPWEAPLDHNFNKLSGKKNTISLSQSLHRQLILLSSLGKGSISSQILEAVNEKTQENIAEVRNKIEAGRLHRDDVLEKYMEKISELDEKQVKMKASAKK